MSKSSIVVRDMTTPIEVPIHVSILTDWQRVIGATGFLLYSWYRLMGAARLPMGGRQIGEVLNMSRISVRHYTRLFELAGLIAVSSGGPSSPNQIDIIDPPAVDVDRLLRSMQSDDLLGGPSGEYFLAAFVERVRGWRPFVLPRSAAIPAANGGSLAGASTNNPRTIPDDPALVAGLAAIGFDGAARWLQSAAPNPALVRAWLDAFNAGEYKDVQNRPGLLRSSVERGERPRMATLALCPRCKTNEPRASGLCASCMDDLGILH